MKRYERKTCCNCRASLHRDDPEYKYAPEDSGEHDFCCDCLVMLQLGEGLVCDPELRKDAARTIREQRVLNDWPGSAIDLVREFKEARHQFRIACEPL
jgi:hypothetical protein